ncbi:MAG: hypothetical protein HQK50_03050 [Oligoflexia bacterium]|nr:hypothetical protein [Oligoflexia bacterium]
MNKKNSETTKMNIVVFRKIKHDILDTLETQRSTLNLIKHCLEQGKAIPAHYKENVLGALSKSNIKWDEIYKELNL